MLKLFEATPFLDHLVDLPAPLLDVVLGFESPFGNAIGLEDGQKFKSLPSIASIVPSSEKLDVATGKVFNGLSTLHVDMAEMMQPNSTCLDDAACQAAVRLRVSKLKKSVRELRMRLGKLPVLTDELKPLLLAMFSTTDVMKTALPDLEVLSSWHRNLASPVPNNAADPATPIVQQMSRVLCKELALRGVQGRSNTPPTWFNMDAKLPYDPACTALDDHLTEEANAVEVGLADAVTSAALFRKLERALFKFSTEIQAKTNFMISVVNAGDGVARKLHTQSEDFTAIFLNVVAAYQQTSGYIVQMPFIVDLSDGIFDLRRAVHASTPIYALKDLRAAIAATTQRAKKAPTEPFLCTTAPVDCTETLARELPLAESMEELNYDRGSPELTTPLTLLTGLGDTTCLLRASGQSLFKALQEITLPLERLVEVLLQGPAAFSGEVPSCDPDDKYCLASNTRATLIYKLAMFPMFYLHFWSLGTPATMCKGPPAVKQGATMSLRFTIPGLWSSSAMQASTFLEHTSVSFGPTCEIYRHLLAYSPAAPGGCTSNYQSFLASTDKWGRLHKVHQMRFASNSQKYQGSTTGITLSREGHIKTIWVCGQATPDSPWAVYSLPLNEQFNDGIQTDAPVAYATTDIDICHTHELPASFGATSGKARCSVHWDKKKMQLWVGNLARSGETGEAKAYQVVPHTCPGGGGTVYKIGGGHVGHVEYGPHVTSFGFLMDVLGDDYLHVTRCDNFARNSEPCAIEFFEVPRSRGFMSIDSGDPGTKIRVPTGVASAVHDTSLGVDSISGGHMHVSFTGRTSRLS